MAYENTLEYDKSTNKTIDICLNCKRKKCNGNCKFDNVDRKIKKKK